MNSFEFYTASGHVLSLPFFIPFVHASGCILMRYNVVFIVEISAATRYDAHKYNACYSLDIKKKFP